MNQYEKILEETYQLSLHGGMKMGLQNSLRLREHADYPDKNYQTIHVAGTNGKGSVSIKIASALAAEGYKVGLYTSPHLSSIRERFKINGKMISKADFTAVMESIFALSREQEIAATFFETLTAAAFVYFSNQHVDFAVIETGLGGRLDATNVITPCLSVITSIEFDHCEILGQTIEEIAREKAGIIKPKVPVVIGPGVPFNIIKEVAEAQSSPVFQVIETDPFFETQNCLIALQALDVLKRECILSDASIQKGLTVKQPCRFEVVGDSPTLILDVAHNPDGLKACFSEVKRRYPSQNIHVVFGISTNKDVSECLKVIAMNGSAFYPVTAENGRGIQADLLAKDLAQFTNLPIKESSSLLLNFETAKKEAAENNAVIVVCGTFFIMAPIRKALGIVEESDFIDLNEKKSNK